MQLLPMPSEDFDRFFSALCEEFCEAERRDRDDARALLINGKYSVYEISKDGVSVGYTALWALPSAVFVEHFVILPEYRNRGYGSEVISRLKSKFPQIILEVEPPTNEPGRRRLDFYKRLGFYEQQEPYLQPSYRKGGAAVPLKIMSWPKPLQSFSDTVAEIYATVYGIKR